MRINAGEDESIDIMLIPLIDCFCFLILFFLVSSTFEKSGNEKALDINLPQTLGGAGKKGAPDNWYINIRRDETLIMSGRSMDLPEMQAMLSSRRKEKDSVNLVIRADSLVPYRVVAKLIGLCSEYGYSRVAFQTLDERQL